MEGECVKGNTSLIKINDNVMDIYTFLSLDEEEEDEPVVKKDEKKSCVIQ